MEFITYSNNNQNKKNISKISLNNYMTDKNNQSKQSFKTETYNSTIKKLFPLQFTSESIDINSDSLNNGKNNIKKNSESKNNKNKGTLYKYINPSYFKQSLGSIPRNSEKIIINEKKINDRFSGSNSIFNQIEENTPGVGSYDIKYDWNLKNKSVNMEKEEKRFPDFYNFMPGVGDYDIEKGKKLQQEKNNLRYNSLYSRTKILFNNGLNKTTKENSFIYEPKILNDIIKFKKNYNFDSYSGRSDYRGSKVPSLFDKTNGNPGPGQYYFTNSENKKSSYFNIRYNKGNDYMNDNNIDKILIEHLNNMKLKEDKPAFNMKQNGNKRENKVYNLEDIHKLNNSHKKIIINEKEELEKLLRENEKVNTSKNLYFNIRQNRELNKIKTILGNDNGRPDYFYLTPERWKNKKTDLKVPGPAYYFY